MKIVTTAEEAAKHKYLKVIGQDADNKLWSITYELHNNSKYGTHWQWASGIADFAPNVFVHSLSRFFIIGVTDIGEKVAGIDTSLEKEAMSAFKIPSVSWLLLQNAKQ